MRSCRSRKLGAKRWFGEIRGATVGAGAADCIRVIACLVAGLAPAACGSTRLIGPFQVGQIVGGGTKQIASVQPVAGFLPNPSLSQPGQQGQPDLVYRSPTANFAPLPVRHAGAGRDLDEPRLASEPGAASATARACQHFLLRPLHGLVAALPDDQNAIAWNAVRARRVGRRQAVQCGRGHGRHLRPRMWAPRYGAASLAFNHGVGYFAGTATAEAYGTDATNGTLLFQAVDRRGGTTAVLENTLNNWLDVHHAFTAWSNEITAKLQQMGVCRT